MKLTVLNFTLTDLKLSTKQTRTPCLSLIMMHLLGQTGDVSCAVHAALLAVIIPLKVISRQPGVHPDNNEEHNFPDWKQCLKSLVS